MPRYTVRRPKSCFAYGDDDESFRPNLTVDERPPQPTGVLDRDGYEFLRLPEPIGFLHFEED